MDSMRKTALVAGIFYLITFISIPTLALYASVKNHADWILSSGGHTAVLAGGFLEVIVALAGIGTAVTLYPVVKRQNEGAALGFAAARVLEAGMIFAGRSHQQPSTPGNPPHPMHCRRTVDRQTEVSQFRRVSDQPAAPLCG